MIFSPVKEDITPNSDYVRGLQQQLHKVHALAKEKLQSSLKVQKENYDARTMAHKYQPGDLVYRAKLQLKIGQCSKLQPKDTVLY